MGLARMVDDPATDDAMSLYRRARQEEAWQPRDVINWSAPATLTGTRLMYAWHLASRHVYSEQTGLIVASTLLAETEDAPVRLALATAVSDEAKHTEVFARCAHHLGGEIEPPNQTADEFAAKLAGLPSTAARFLVHTVLEGIALDEFSLLAKLFDDDPLSRIYHLVRRDEARHVAIGLEYLARMLRVSPHWRAEFWSYESQARETAGLHGANLDLLGEQLGWAPGRVGAWLLDRHRARIARLAPVGVEQAARPGEGVDSR
jgi:hypothetical protein